MVALLACASAVSAEEIFRWVDENGKTHFGDRPPASAEPEKLELRINVYESPEIVSRSPPSAKANAGGRPRVVLYSTRWCGHCKQAKAYFKANKIPFSEFDVEKTRKGQADFKRMKGRGVPIILVGESRLNGFSPAAFERLYRPKRS